MSRFQQSQKSIQGIVNYKKTIINTVELESNKRMKENPQYQKEKKRKTKTPTAKRPIQSNPPDNIPKSREDEGKKDRQTRDVELDTG